MRTRHRLEAVHRLLERLDSMLVVRDPGGARSAEAYDGLRKTVLASAKARRIHISHLLSLRDSIDKGAGLQLVGDRVSDFLIELGVIQTSDVSLPLAFDIPDGSADQFRCVAPAILDLNDDGTYSVIRQGVAVQTPSASRPSDSPATSFDDSECLAEMSGPDTAKLGREGSSRAAHTKPSIRPVLPPLSESDSSEETAP